MKILRVVLLNNHKNVKYMQAHGILGSLLYINVTAPYYWINLRTMEIKTAYIYDTEVTPIIPVELTPSLSLLPDFETRLLFLIAEGFYKPLTYVEKPNDLYSPRLPKHRGKPTYAKQCRVAW